MAAPTKPAIVVVRANAESDFEAAFSTLVQQAVWSALGLRRPVPLHSHIVAGRLNKQIAGDLGTVEKTIKFHRGHIMKKLGVRTVADLVRLAEKAGVPVAKS
jgi:FixJ family two-component response regulator